MSFEEQIISKDKIYEDIFAPNGGLCVYYPLNIFHNTQVFENWGISFVYSSVLTAAYSIT